MVNVRIRKSHGNGSKQVDGGHDIGIVEYVKEHAMPSGTKTSFKRKSPLLLSLLPRFQ